MADELEKIKCVILTLRKQNVILPNALVAEILSVKEVLEVDNSPEWLLGTMSWHGKDIPLLSFEGAGEDGAQKVNLNTQAVVLYAVGKTGDDLEKPFLGLVMSGVPHVTEFSSDQIQGDLDDVAEHPMVAQKIRINGASVSILDVDAMAEMVAELAA